MGRTKKKIICRVSFNGHMEAPFFFPNYADYVDIKLFLGFIGGDGLLDAETVIKIRHFIY